jgi:hypothetical protein
MTDRREHNRNLGMIRPKSIELERSRESNAEKNVNSRLKNMFSKKQQMFVLELMNLQRMW